MHMFLILLVLPIPFVLSVFSYALVNGRYIMSWAAALAFGGICFMLIAYLDGLTTPAGDKQPDATVTAPAVTTTVQPRRTVTITPTVTVTRGAQSRDNTKQDSTGKDNNS